MNAVSRTAGAGATICLTQVDQLQPLPLTRRPVYKILRAATYPGSYGLKIR